MGDTAARSIGALAGGSAAGPLSAGGADGARGALTVERMAGVSGGAVAFGVDGGVGFGAAVEGGTVVEVVVGVGAGLGLGVGGAGALAAALDFDGFGDDSSVIRFRIRPTISGSRLARALALTSSCHFWIRSISSGLFNPSSLANSWTRVDNGDSSRVGHDPRRQRSGRPDRYCELRRSVVPAQFPPETDGPGGVSRQGGGWGATARSALVGGPVGGLMVGSCPALNWLGWGVASLRLHGRGPKVPGESSDEWSGSSAEPVDDGPSVGNGGVLSPSPASSASNS